MPIITLFKTIMRANYPSWASAGSFLCILLQRKVFKDQMLQFEYSFLGLLLFS